MHIGEPSTPERPVAFFDIDGTLFRSSLLVELVEELVVQGVFPVAARDAYDAARHAWRNREQDYESFLQKVIDSFTHHIKGVYYGEFADVARAVIALQQKHVYRYTRDLIAKLQNEGYFLVAISQSPKTVLDQFCRNYGFDKVYGRIYETGPQDRFTGAVADEHLIANKAAIVSRVLAHNPVTRVQSVGVGDTEGDISLLSEVARPICFNPNRQLYTHAQHCGWEVVVERKDVVYHVQ